MRRLSAAVPLLALLAASACSSKPTALASLSPLPSKSDTASAVTSSTGSPTESASATASASATPSVSASPTEEAPRDLASVFRSAAASSGSAGSARITMTMDLPGGQGSMKMSGVEKWKGGLAADFTAIMNMQGQNVVMRELITPDTIYIKLGGAAAKNMPTPWLSISLKDAGSMTGIDIQQMLDQAEQADPSKTVELLAAAGDIEEVGTETVDGAPATHYQGTADFDKLAGAKNLDKKLLAQLKAAGTDAIGYDLWLNEAGLPVKLIEKMDVKGQPITVTMTMSDYGVPVTVKRPAKNQVTDMAALMKRAKA